MKPLGNIRELYTCRKPPQTISWEASEKCGQRYIKYRYSHGKDGKISKAERGG